MQQPARGLRRGLRGLQALRERRLEEVRGGRRFARLGAGAMNVTGG